MEQTNKFSYSIYGGCDYSGVYDSIEEALAAAKIDAKNSDKFRDATTVYIGRVCKFVPVVNAWRIIENLQDMADDEAYEFADDYLRYVSKDEATKLGQMLTEAFNKWARETGNEPTFFTVIDVTEYSLEEGKQCG